MLSEMLAELADTVMEPGEMTPEARRMLSLMLRRHAQEAASMQTLIQAAYRAPAAGPVPEGCIDFGAFQEWRWAASAVAAVEGQAR